MLTAYQPPMSLYTDSPSRRVAIYDGGECAANYEAYDERCLARGGKINSRPREWVHTRPDALRHLKAVKTPIAFKDAIGMAEAAQILQVHESLIPRMVASGKIMPGKCPRDESPRGGRQKAGQEAVQKSLLTCSLAVR